jgi:protoporphyrin/coproporphyrin ferrochelatase
MNKTAVILINTGSPDSPATADVRKYLREFLGDPRVITMPALLRKILVNGIITTFRAPKSAKLYQKVWTPQGSPLLYHTQSLKDKLQKLLSDDFEVITGMRYGKPSLKSALQTVQEKKFSKVILMPLYPQYASSTTGSAIDFAFSEIKKWNRIPAVSVQGQFYNHRGFIENFAAKITAHTPAQYDHILFSYHSLPESHVKATHPGKTCDEARCRDEINTNNQFCYQAACYETTRLLAAQTKLKTGCYTVCFQSRFSKNWIGPFTDQVIVEKAKQGVKKILVVSPAFVTDCLETIVEIGHDYNELFIANGGQKLQLVQSLNDNDDWAKVLSEIIRRL